MIIQKHSVIRDVAVSKDRSGVVFSTNNLFAIFSSVQRVTGLDSEQLTSVNRLQIYEMIKALKTM